MADRELTTLIDGGSFFEGPRWHEGRWYVSDFYRHTVFAITPGGDDEVIVELEPPNQPSGLGWLPDGSLLIVSMLGKRVLRLRSDGTISEHADLSGLCAGKANDMVVDEQGRAFVGNFGFDLMGGADPQPADLVRVDPDGSATTAATDLYFPNGSVIDGNTLIVGETMGARYTAFDIDEDGTLSNRRIWGQMAPTPELGNLQETLAAVGCAPDGCGLDAEGHIWAADALNGRCVRIAPGGEIVEELPAPEGLNFYACMLGGEDGRTLLICAAPDFFEHNRKAAREAVLVTTAVDVPHGGLP
jgi:sugar lactone lactonase YvrE